MRCHNDMAQIDSKSQSSPRKTRRSGRYARSDNNNRSPYRSRKENTTERRNRSRVGKQLYTERCKGIGAVLFTLGIPASIAGVILTVVAATDNDKENKYPDSFLAVGPILLVLALLLFCIGTCLYSSFVADKMRDFFSLDEPTSFCRVHCPRLSQWLKPDGSIARNQAAMKALQSEPGKPVLKKNIPATASEHGKTVDELTMKSVKASHNGTGSGSIGTCTGDEKSDGIQSQQSSKGVRFSESGESDLDLRGNFTSSESGSILSLRHCKVSPKTEQDTIWWTDETMVQNGSNQPDSHVSKTTEL